MDLPASPTRTEPAPPTAPFRLGVVLLAAGASMRMGKPKLLLPWGETSVLGHLLQQWRRLGPEQIAVVSSAASTALDPELAQHGVGQDDRIFNLHPEQGMFSSVQSAARWNGWHEWITHWALVLGDQPQIGMETLRQVLTFAQSQPGQVCQPSYRHRPRHPVVLPKPFWQRLADASETTLKQFLLAQPETTALIEIADPALDLDLDTPDEYASALRRFVPN
ncbi:MAG: nucleotidyltransferase family protein [Verrucomicrobiota bacterium]